MLEFDDIIHTYTLDGREIPSVTTLLSVIKYSKKYENIPPNILEKAAERGTIVHQDIEAYCKFGIDSKTSQVRHFKFLQKTYGFEVLENELPTYYLGEVDFAGTIDLVLKINDEIALADIKTTSILDKEYLAYQLNLYRLAYEQRTGQKVSKLYGIHIREDKRRFIPIPINEEFATEILRKYKEVQ